MRRRRAVIYDDNYFILKLLEDYFMIREYEVLTYNEPVVCPIAEEKAECANLNPCADIMIIDFMMPKMNGIELLKAQIDRGCKLSVQSKALVSGYENAALKVHRELGCVFFKKPFNLDEISKWLSERERLMDLSRPLGIRRNEKRYKSNEKVTYLGPLNDERHTGIAVNKSTSGLCMKTDTRLLPEQSLTVHFGHPDLSRAASVRWITEIDHGHYMVGLSLK